MGFCSFFPAAASAWQLRTLVILHLQYYSRFPWKLVPTQYSPDKLTCLVDLSRGAGGQSDSDIQRQPASSRMFVQGMGITNGACWVQGLRFAVLHGDGPRPSLSIYAMKDMRTTARGVQLINTVPSKAANVLHWSPQGKNLVIGGLKASPLPPYYIPFDS